MSNNTHDGNENFWPANQQPPPSHHYAHAQHHHQLQQHQHQQHQQQLHQTLLQQQPLPQLLPHPPHLSYAVPSVPVVAPSAAAYYHNAAGMVDNYAANGNGFPLHHGTHQPLEDEYMDPYGQQIKVVYPSQQQHQAAAASLVACQQDEVNQNHGAQDKQGYELFSNNSSFVLAAPGFGFTLHSPQQNQQHQQQQQQQQQQQLPQFSSLSTTQPIANHPIPAAVPPVAASSTHSLENGSSSTSALISQLVGNWAPTISGTYGNGPASQERNEPTPPQTPANITPSVVREDNVTGAASPAKAAPTKPVINPVPPHVTGAASQAQVSQGSPSASVAAAAAAVYNQQNDDNSAKLDQNVNKKQRIVAEVKPMRMSYSDVLSKNVPAGGAATASALLNGEMVSVLPAQHGATGATKGGSGATGTNGGGAGTKSKREGKRANGGERKSAGSGGSGAYPKERGGDGATTLKKPDRTNGAGSGTLVSPLVDVSTRAEGNGENGLRMGQDKGRKNEKVTSGKKDKSSRVEALDSGGKKGRATSGSDESNGQRNRTDATAPNSDETEEERVDDYDEYESDEYDRDSVDSGDKQGDTATAGHDPDLPFVYNVKKTTNGTNVSHIEKINPPRATAAAATTSTSAATYRKGRSARTGPTKQSSDKTNGPSTSGQGAKRSVRSRKNHKYAFVEKLLLKWLEYTVLALHWLWSLVSDVVYLSGRLAWDYALAGYQYCWQHARTLRQDFGKNSTRPGAWFRGVCQSFDGRFAQDSRWAFWRRCRRQKPAEPATGKPTGAYRDGRLPSTADEAMSSLLNCKGKDAYSILGVSPDCTQEQIRKHYKKIAVLVHPDKNKQPGAEEAFKVLQRSFELIGEPESRQEYDQSLAEALNAEKAWSEINDLLTQLHTKISEAANTIRCSSCCLRHPRKPTGRAHYAARECSSCKIRHPAREGDIWAETSFLGLRWKYLAMMEGNVYDITEWANCQKGALSHLQPNSHIVQYRIVLGSSSQQQQQQQQHQQQHPAASQQGGGSQQDKEQIGRSRKDPTANEPNLDDFLNNIYAGQNQQGNAASQSASSRRRYRRN
uniref:J domain-containing protein n=1 Tax=Anopheles dirus TaxID=7168 RepID=A0A1Y9H2H4_9DIPT